MFLQLQEHVACKVASGSLKRQQIQDSRTLTLIGRALKAFVSSFRNSPELEKRGGCITRARLRNKLVGKLPLVSIYKGKPGKYC
jgi:hypothetical protein